MEDLIPKDLVHLGGSQLIKTKAFSTLIIQHHQISLL